MGAEIVMELFDCRQTALKLQLWYPGAEMVMELFDCRQTALELPLWELR